MTDTSTRPPIFTPTIRDAAAEGGESSPHLDPLIHPTWAEVAEAREHHRREAKRLRTWRWWFVGMFTFYTTLVGILMARLMLGT